MSELHDHVWQIVLADVGAQIRRCACGAEQGHATLRPDESLRQMFARLQREVEVPVAAPATEDSVKRAIAEAVAAERERCLRITWDETDHSRSDRDLCAQRIAERIRGGEGA